MAKPKPEGEKCGHLMPRSPRHPVGDLPCGAPVKFRVVFGPEEGATADVCGRHANYWAVRNKTTINLSTWRTAS